MSHILGKKNNTKSTDSTISEQQYKLQKKYLPSNTVKYFSCIYCGSEFIAVKPDDIHTKANKYKINRDDIEIT